jgi:hypothetical protein
MGVDQLMAERRGVAFDLQDTLAYFGQIAKKPDPSSATQFQPPTGADLTTFLHMSKMRHFVWRGEASISFSERWAGGHASMSS